jgi:glucose uptake protein
MMEFSFMASILLCVGSALLWGTYYNPLKHCKRFREVEYSNSLLLSALPLAWLVFFAVHGCGWFDMLVEHELGVVIAFLAGVVWGIGNYGALIAVREFGLATSYPITNMCGAVAFIWGVGAFGEMRAPGTPNWIWGLAAMGIVVMSLGALMASKSANFETSVKKRNIKRGITYALIAALCFGTFAGGGVKAAFNQGLEPFSYCAISVTGSLVFFMLYGGLRRGQEFRNWIHGGRDHLLAAGAGLMWMGGNFLNFMAVPTLGVAVAFPIGLLNTIVASLWGILYYKEFKGLPRRALLYVVGGAIILVLGVIMLGLARGLSL